MPDLILAPNYQQSDNEMTTCGRCRFGGTGECRLYDFPYLSQFTCESWQNGVQENAHNGVMIALMVPSAVGELLLADIPDPVPVDELHLTLGYLGKAGEMFFGPEYLRLLIEDFASWWFELPGAINGVGRFNRGDGDTEAFYASFDCKTLAHFRHELAEHLALNGIPLSTDHGFTPHITLSYVPQLQTSPIENLPPIPLTFRDITVGWGDRLWSIPLLSESSQPKSYELPIAYPYGETLYDVGDSYYAEMARSWKPGQIVRAKQPQAAAISEVVTVSSDTPKQSPVAALPETTLNLNEANHNPGFLKRMGTAILNAIGLGHLLRSIKDVDSWSGAAAQYESTADYCDACLINLNSGDREEWVQGLCKLPVREPGDAPGVYVRQAVYAAAARFNQLMKPADVDEAAWNAAVRAAARELVQAYEEMDEEPPQVITDAARSRAVHRDAIAALQSSLYDMSVAIGRPCLLHAIMYEEGRTEAVIICEGVLYKAEFAVIDDEVYFGEWEVIEPIVEMDEVEMEERGRITVSRALDGRYHYTLISATPFLNRVGEIDSVELFDDFINHARSTGDYPRLDFLHFGEAMILGQSYFLDRVGLAYVEMGWFDDSPVGRSFAQAVADDPIYWGESIQYAPTRAPVMEEVAEGIYALVYRGGIHRFTSLLPEALAANLFTSAAVRGDDHIMSMTQPEFDAFLRGTAQLTDEQREALLSRVRSVNRAGDSGTHVFRAAAPAEVEVKLPDFKPVIDDIVTQVVARVNELIGTSNNAIAEQVTISLNDLAERIEAVEEGQQKLEADVNPIVEQERTRQADKPAGREGGTSLFIPRFQRTAADNTEATPKPLAQTAEATINKIFGS